ncbi:hypothetical protein QFC22_005568 [Naganishia vaughanmartiniae]|uniref:Uncharacterized protein n=1 Tax=Naganishia vaughanmartiniae TaxID=1424756 RepID=A0ACC2WVX3_9TREE|nr:hypothetical protein QFC22_005568 [Naganishia vaughanmartiniae]
MTQHTNGEQYGGTEGVKRIRLSLPLSTPAPKSNALHHPAHTVDRLITAIPQILRNEHLQPGNSLHSLYNLCTRLLRTASRQGDGSVLVLVDRIITAAVEGIQAHADVLQRRVRADARVLANAGGTGSSGVGSPGVDFLRNMLEQWKVWETATNRLGAVIMLADRMAVMRDPRRTVPLARQAMDIFRKTVLEEQSIQERCAAAVGEWLKDQLAHSDTEHPGPVSELAQIRNTITRAFATFTLRLAAAQPYIDLYVRETAGFITHAANNWITRIQEHSSETPAASAPTLSSGQAGEPATAAATAFVRWVSEKLEEVQGRTEYLFQPAEQMNPDGSPIEGRAKEAWRQCKLVLERDVVETLVVQVAGQALTEAMEGSDVQALKRLYTLLTSVKKFTEFRKVLSAHVKTHATNLISKPENDATMVPSLITFKRFCDSSIASLYDPANPANPMAFKTAEGEHKEARRRLALESEVRDGLKAGMETRQAVPAELIAKHLHRLMEKGQGTRSEAEWDRLMDEIVDLVKFTKDKDIFREFYISQLAKRLLSGRSASNEDEIKMVKKLQNEFGEEFTTGDAMMKDLAQSEEMNKKWTDARMTAGKEPSSLTVNVLSQGQWPPYKQLKTGWENLSVPRNMQQQLDDFASWYGHTFSGRVLSWRHQHSSVTMTARFPAGNKEIDVSLFQAMVLLQFNDTKSLSFEEISERTGIERQELIRTLQSLYALKATRMLVKRPPGKEVEPGDKFIWNGGFTREDRIRFKINQLQQDMTAEESRQTNEKVFEDRNLTLDAQIVRIMKGKKVLKLPDLINAVVDAVKNMFQPEVKAIKTQVESLIEREYLERDENDRNLLKYMA